MMFLKMMPLGAVNIIIYQSQGSRALSVYTTGENTRRGCEADRSFANTDAQRRISSFEAIEVVAMHKYENIYHYHYCQRLSTSRGNKDFIIYNSITNWLQVIWVVYHKFGFVTKN